MLKKKYLISLIAILLAVVYSVGMYFSFANAKSQAYDELMETHMNILNKLEEYISYTESKGKVNITIDDAITEFIGYSNIPYSVCFFDENDKLIASTQDYIYFYDEKSEKRYCFIEKYVNDDLKKQIKQAYYSGALLGESCFYYLESEDGSLVPVTFVFKNPHNNNIIEEIKFTDYDQYNDKDKQFGTYLTVDGQVTKKIQSRLHIISFEIPYILTDNKLLKQYDYTMKQIVNDGKLVYNEQPDYDDAYEFRFNLEKYDEFMPIVCNDGSFSVCVVGKVDPNMYALNYHAFRNQATIMTVVLLMLLVVAIVFIRYFDKKQMLSQARYDFANAAAHELKTPLAVIQNQCECIMEKVNVDNNDSYVYSVYEEALRMNKLVSNLLEYNSLATKAKLKCEKTNLSIIVNNEVEKYKSSMETKDLSVVKNIAPDCYVLCDGELIGLVIDNFLSNAVKFAVDGSDIVVSLTSDDGKATLSVFNKGKGIDKTNKELWTILYKEDKSRKSSGSSSGMGLAVSGRILDLHKFKYGFRNRDAGVEFYFVAK